MSDRAADERIGLPACRLCEAPLRKTFVDLGMSPLAESFLGGDQLRKMEPFYPLNVLVCEQCFLVQLEAFVPASGIFSEYAYFSGYSSTWVDHARRYVEKIRHRLELGSDDLAVEIASNDGYLLQHFLGSGIPILGIDPAENVAQAARAKGVSTLTEFFGQELASKLVRDGKRASLVIANNVLAHVPDPTDFVAGIRTLLRDGGTATLEFPSLLRLIEGLQYDTIYHEHFSYFSFGTASELMSAQGLEVYDVEQLPTHGGSLRIYVQRAGGPNRRARAVNELLAVEEAEGLRSLARYERFAENVKEAKRALLELLIGIRREGKRVVGYGAPGKSTTLLNFCGIGTDFLEYVVDRNPYKHGLYTPGTHIPIHPPERIAETRPDYVVVLPWNLLDEITAQIAYVSDWGASLIVPIPRAMVMEPREVMEGGLGRSSEPAA